MAARVEVASVARRRHGACFSMAISLREGWQAPHRSFFVQSPRADAPSSSRAIRVRRHSIPRNRPAHFEILPGRSAGWVRLVEGYILFWCASPAVGLLRGLAAAGTACFQTLCLGAAECQEMFPTGSEPQSQSAVRNVVSQSGSGSQPATCGV